MKNSQIEELLVQALETEMGGIQIYQTALKAVQNKDLKKEWTEYLDQTTKHEQTLREVFEVFGFDPAKETPGRKIVRHLGKSLVRAIEMALEGGTPEAAELVAAECVVLAETKDHMNWELIGKVAESLKGEEKKTLKGAHAKVEDEEDEHLYHTGGWTRELWIKSLGMPAVLPPPEEQKDVKTAIGAQKAKNARKEML